MSICESGTAFGAQNLLRLKSAENRTSDSRPNVRLCSQRYSDTARRTFRTQPVKTASLMRAVLLFCFSAAPACDEPPPRGLEAFTKERDGKDAHNDPGECQRWAAGGECGRNPKFMMQACKISCTAAGKIPQDRHSDPNLCVQWATAGECDSNPSFMFESCAGSCFTQGFTKKAYATRCPSTNATAGLKPGRVMPLVRQAVENFPELSPRLLSPSPPIAVFDEFLRAEEISAFISAGKGRFQRSTGLGLREDGTTGSIETPIRTSSNTWCDTPGCQANEHVRRVTERVATVTGLPQENFEFAQLLEYTACPADGHASCQYYRRQYGARASNPRSCLPSPSAPHR